MKTENYVAEIRTTYKGATNTLGSRIIARGNGHSVTIPYPYHLSGRDVHELAARNLLDLLRINCYDIAKAESKTSGYLFKVR